MSSPPVLARYGLAWLGLALLAILNGLLREETYGPRMSELRAHQLSTLIGVLLTGAAVFAVTRLWPIATARQALSIGVMWLAMTVAFELGFGHWVAGHPWGSLLHDYDLSAGRVWPLFLAWILASPYVFFRLGGGSGRRE